MKKLNLISLVAGLVGLLGAWSNASALCQGRVESQGCLVNGNGPQNCRGTNGGDVIVAPAAGCTNFSGATNCIISGRGGSDLIVGSNRGDRICGNSGSDIALGVFGNDTIALGGSRDTGLGQGGNDTLRGGPSGDVLVGGPGPDTNVGGGGTDVCVQAATNLRCEF